MRVKVHAFNSIYWIRRGGLSSGAGRVTRLMLLSIPFIGFPRTGIQGKALRIDNFQFHLLDSRQAHSHCEEAQQPCFQFHLLDSLATFCRDTALCEVCTFNSIYWIHASISVLTNESFFTKPLSIPFIGFRCFAMFLSFPLRIRNSVQFISD